MTKLTMIDVARCAGVSPMTVSRALNGNSSVKQATRERIIAAANELGYLVNSAAAGLASRKTGFIAVTVPTINNANFAETVQGIAETLDGAGLQLLLGYTNYKADEEERLVEEFLRRRPEAIIVTGGNHTVRCRGLLQRYGIPVIEIWDLPSEPIGNVVGFSNAAAAALMANHLVQRGYRRIGFIGGDDSQDTRGLDRRRGFLKALALNGLDASRLVASGPPPISMMEGAASMRQLLATWPDTEAVMCVSDLSAFGALTECQRMGILVPDDIAIAGFGAYEISEICVPAITTIDVIAKQIGVLTGNRILQLLGHLPALEANVVEVEPRLVVREST